MADEGIMALPQGMGMQDKGAQPPRPTVTSADSYDAAQTALGMVNPQEQSALKEAIRQNIGDLQVTPQQLDVLIQVLEYVSQNPGDYKNLLQKMIETGALDEGDMPPEYDPEFIGAMLAVLQEMRQMQGAGAQEPMDLSPVVEGLQPVGMASGGLADVGQYLASKGRGGDRILAHITPEEAALLKRRGGAGTINPATGLPEFKDDPFTAVFKGIGDVFKGVADVAKDILKSPVGSILGTIALATVLGPTAIGAYLGSAGTAALASGTVTLAGGGNIKDALISGAMGYIGGGGTIMGASPVSAVGGYMSGLAPVGSALNTGLSTGLIGTGIGMLGGMRPEDALKMGLTSGVSAGALQGLRAESGGGVTNAQQMLANQSGGSSSLQLPPGAAPKAGYTVAGSQPGFMDKMLSGAKDLYGEYLSPSRPGLPKDAGLLQKYGPLALAGTAVMAATGGMEGEPADQNPLYNRYYTGSDYIRDNPDKFKGGLSSYTKPAVPRNPIVPAPSYDTISVTMPTNAIPTGVTRSPGGVAQPYNMEGLYNVPLIYGPDGQLRRMAKGGDAKMTNFPRRDGPINGPGTGTSDDIPAMLSDGEFVFTAKAVRNAGGGSRRKGAARMYKLMKKLEGGAVKGK